MKDYRFTILEGHIVRTAYVDEVGNEHFWDIYLENVFWGGKISFPMEVDEDSFDRILWMYELTDEEFAKTGEFREKGNSTGVVCIYSNKSETELNFIMYTNKEQMYKSFLLFKHKKESVTLGKKCLHLSFEGMLESFNSEQLEIKKIDLVIDNNNRVNISELDGQDNEYKKVSIKVPLSSITEKETEINNPIHLEIIVNDATLKYQLGYSKRKKMQSKFQYVPITAKYYKDKALFVRGNVNRNYSLVVRPREAIEYNSEFLKYESELYSWFFKTRGRISKRIRHKPINLYYEKDSMKAEEGTFEVFQQASGLDTSDNYFILDRKSAQWDEVSKHKNVIPKYSKEYYKLLYSADYFISTETPSHLNVHRSLNSNVRKTLLEKDFFFLQHGVTYLKCQGESSVFGAGKEGEPDYIVVGSDKEAQAVSKMLHIPMERCVKTGLPVFSTIEYQHIDEKAPDVVTIMLTWKPSEEHLINHFEDSSYYINVLNIYKELLKYVDEEKIRIVPHPKVYKLIKATKLAKRVWSGKVSEALYETKLLITDYSSVCYNAFYQGAAVIFYQPDLQEYQKEVGNLVPQNDEYIGYRYTKWDDLKQGIGEGLKKGYIDLPYLRSEKFVDRYHSINEFHDKKNVERIVTYLIEKKII